jgi:tight adherence protein C
MIEITLSTLMVFLSVFIGFQTLFGGGKSNTGRLRLGQIRSSEALLANADDTDDPAGILYGENSPLLKKLAPIVQGSQQQPTAEESVLRTRLVRAGFRRKDAPTLYNMVRILGILSSGGAWVFLSGILGLDTLSALALTGIIAISCFLLPSVFLDSRAKTRQGGIDKNLPSAIDLLAVSVDAGMGIGQALARVGREFERVSPVLAEELQLVAMQTAAGRTSADALRDFSERIGSQQLSLLVNTLIQTERFGTNVAEALRDHSEDMRSHRLQAAEERAGRAAVLMLLPTALIMLSILAVILGLGAIKASNLLS